jgi:predicted anti-sigma-YlaC factor YlaD
MLMAACREYDELLTLHAAEALEPQEAMRVRSHLESCAACRAELQAHREVLELVSLPPPSPREQAVRAALPRTTVAAWRAARVKQAARTRIAGALLAAAAVVLLVLGPVLSGRESSRAPPPETLESSLSEETPSTLEQWSMEDPLAEALAALDENLEWLETEASASELEDVPSFPAQGDSL